MVSEDDICIIRLKKYVNNRSIDSGLDAGGDCLVGDTTETSDDDIDNCSVCQRQNGAQYGMYRNVTMQDGDPPR